MTEKRASNGDVNAQGAREFFTVEDLFSGGDDAISIVELPGVAKGSSGGFVRLKEPSTESVLRFSEENKDSAPGDETATYRLIVEATVDKDNKPLFDVEHPEALAKLPIRVFNALSAAVTKMITETTGQVSNNDEVLTWLEQFDDLDYSLGRLVEMRQQELAAGNESSGADGSASPTN